MKLPLIHFKRLFHVGTLDITLKKENSYEGNNGLSVSTEPDVWRQINRGVTTGDTFALTKENGTFIDFHAISKAYWNSIYQWGVEHGYLVPCIKYQFSYFDDEYNQTYTFSFFDKEEAEIEAEGYDAAIDEINSYKATSFLSSLVGLSNADDPSLIIIAYCMANTECDGVYWTDKLNPLSYSAPRGIIFQDKLSSWIIQKNTL